GAGASRPGDVPAEDRPAGGGQGHRRHDQDQRRDRDRTGLPHRSAPILRARGLPPAGPLGKSQNPCRICRRTDGLLPLTPGAPDVAGGKGEPPLPRRRPRTNNNTLPRPPATVSCDLPRPPARGRLGVPAAPRTPRPPWSCTPDSPPSP